MEACMIRALFGDQKPLPTPRATDGSKGGPNQRGSSGDLMLPSAVMRMLPTPRATDGKGAFPLSRPESKDDLQTRIIRLLKTPTAQLAINGGSQHPDKRRQGGHGATLADEVEHLLVHSWGPYTLAVQRWERVFGHPAPEPTEPGLNGPRMTTRFPEWMMGLPEGWVTAVSGVPRNHQLKAIGNGVVPQQGAEALRRLLARRAERQDRKQSSDDDLAKLP